MKLNHAEPGQCAICRLTEDGWGFVAANNRKKVPPTWACKADIKLAKAVHTMPDRDLNNMEIIALQDAGAEAGAYLDGIGKTDIGALSDAEWNTFLIMILNRFGEKMRDRLGANLAPF